MPKANADDETKVDVEVMVKERPMKTADVELTWGLAPNANGVPMPAAKCPGGTLSFENRNLHKKGEQFAASVTSENFLQPNDDVGFKVPTSAMISATYHACDANYDVVLFSLLSLYMPAIMPGSIHAMRGRLHSLNCDMLSWIRLFVCSNGGQLHTLSGSTRVLALQCCTYVSCQPVCCSTWLFCIAFSKGLITNCLGMVEEHETLSEHAILYGICQPSWMCHTGRLSETICQRH